MSAARRAATAIILAAGESSRMGRAKALLPFRKGTFLSELAGTLAAHCDPVIAVFGANAEELMARAPESVASVKNENYKQGMLTSLQAGLRQAGPGRGVVVFTPVDHPAFRAGTVEALLRSRAAITIPRFEGRRGHPVALRGAVIEEILAEPGTSKIHDVIDRHAAEIDYIEVDDPGICDDVDDPSLYERLIAREAERA